jgi:hypothetical protein
MVFVGKIDVCFQFPEIGKYPVKGPLIISVIYPPREVISQSPEKDLGVY